MMDARDLLYEPAEYLVQRCPVSIATVRRWQRTGRVPPVPARLLEWVAHGQLGALAPAWAGFSVRGEHLWTRDGFAVTPGEVCAIPYRAQQLAALQRILDNPHQWELFR